MMRRQRMLKEWITEYPKMCVLKKDLSILDDSYQDIQKMNYTEVTETKLFKILENNNIAYGKLIDKYNNSESIFLFL